MVWWCPVAPSHLEVTLGQPEARRCRRQHRTRSACSSLARAHREPLLSRQLRRSETKRAVAPADGRSHPGPGHHVRVLLSDADADVGRRRVAVCRRHLRKLRYLEEEAPGRELSHACGGDEDAEVTEITGS